MNNQQNDWQAKWIYLSNEYITDYIRGDGLPPVIFKKQVHFQHPIKSATLFASSLGIYQVNINDKKVGDAEYAPGWTDYHKRIQYQMYDVTDLVRQNENNIVVQVANGWYTGNIAIAGRKQYGSYPLEFIAQLEIIYEDGTKQIITTDESWEASTGAIIYSDLQTGEYYDANKEEIDIWYHVSISDKGHCKLVPQHGPCLKVMEEIQPVTIETVSDKIIVDMGQNMVGRICITFKANKGQKVEFKHGEMLYDDKRLYVENLRTAKQTDVYIAKGYIEECFEPKFTIHGFRYVEISGLNEEEVIKVTGKVIYADTPRVGWFECSNEKVNQLYNNIVWGQKGNFNSIPTDCPQRDERMGWTGDAQIFAKTACFNMYCNEYFEKYMRDMVDAQMVNGAFTDVVPYVRMDDGSGLVGYGHAAWGDAGIIIPWTLYKVYGNKSILEKYYPQMCHHMQYLLDTSKNYIRDDNGYGDWLSINADTPNPVMVTAFMAYCASLMSEIAEVLGNNDDQARYKTLFEHIKAAFNENFVDENVKIQGETQTCYVLALKFELLDNDKRQDAARHLVHDIVNKGYKLSTGFVGVSYLLPMLSEYGYTDIAYKLLLQEEYPSWLYSINNGATTIWERWNSYTIESGFGDVGMNSFNHYSLGSVGEWMFEYMAGISQKQDSCGYNNIIIKPHLDKSIEWVKAKYKTAKGEIKVYWQMCNKECILKVEIPKGAEATVVLPNGDEDRITVGEYSYSFS